MHLHTKYQQNSSLHNGNIQIKPICTHILTMKNKDGRRSNIKRPIQKPVGYVKHNVLQYLHIEYQDDISNRWGESAFRKQLKNVNFLNKNGRQAAILNPIDPKFTVLMHLGWVHLQPKY